MGICRHHWPEDAVMIKVCGHGIPANPPSLFPNSPSYQQQAKAIPKQRNITERGIASEVRNSTPDQLDQFEQEDAIPKCFSDFVNVLYIKQYPSLQVHVIKSETTVHIMSFNNSFNYIV